MKLSIPISIIIASVVLVIGFFGMEYYKSYKVRQSCEIAWVGYNSQSVWETKIELCVLENR